jgi:hypothetical protein
MNRLDELEAKLREEARDWSASPDLEAALLAEFPRKAPVPIRRVLGSAAILAIAATMLIVLWPKPKPAQQAKPAPVMAHVAAPAPAAPAAPVADIRRRPHRRALPAASEGEFIRIPYTAALEPYERADIVRVELPVAALMATGLRIQTADASAKAQADLIVGEDGMARAIRLISIVNNE